MDSDSDSDESTWRGGSDSTGELLKCKKRKLTSSLKNYTSPSLNKAIPSLNSNISNKKISKIANKNGDSGDILKINIAKKKLSNSDLKRMTKIRIASKNKTKKSCPIIDKENLTKNNDS